MINKVILIGNMGADPEVRVLESGTKTARLRVATTERIYNRQTQESRDHTEWHTVTLWRQMADFADRFAKKGSQVYVEGKIRSHEWEDEATHTKRIGIEILADEFRLLGRRESSGEGGGYSAPQSSTPVDASRPAYPQPQQPVCQPPQEISSVDESDDLPF
ncbi:MAG: single-stranded DNA-binding protein [Rikenellaceae bacterium]|jgi:single-strand DNA-binding protein|nr:single-stranded DNA-binding protein [Rikenellaceae bacterium]